MVGKPALSLLIDVRRVDRLSNKAAVTQPFLLAVASGIGAEIATAQFLWFLA